MPMLLLSTVDDQRESPAFMCPCRTTPQSLRCNSLGQTPACIVPPTSHAVAIALIVSLQCLPSICLYALSLIPSPLSPERGTAVLLL